MTDHTHTPVQLIDGVLDIWKDHRAQITRQHDVLTPEQQAPEGGAPAGAREMEYVPPIQIGKLVVGIQQYQTSLGYGSDGPGYDVTNVLTAVDKDGQILQVSMDYKTWPDAWRPTIMGGHDILKGDQEQLEKFYQSVDRFRRTAERVKRMRNSPILERFM
jgi:hypothetical protein